MKGGELHMRLGYRALKDPDTPRPYPRPVKSESSMVDLGARIFEIFLGDLNVQPVARTPPLGLPPPCSRHD